MQIPQLRSDVANATRPSAQSLVSPAQNPQFHAEVADTTASALRTGQATCESREKRGRGPEPSSRPNKRVKTENEFNDSSNGQCRLPISDSVDASVDNDADTASENKKLSADGFSLEPALELLAERLSSPLSEHAVAGASQPHQSLHDQSNDSQSYQNDPSSQSQGRIVSPRSVDGIQAFQALMQLEDPRKQEALAQHHAQRTLQVGHELAKKAFDHNLVEAYSKEGGWIVDANFSRNAGASEVGPVVEFDMPIIRGDARPPKPTAHRWVPGPDGMTVQFKKELGLIVTNNNNCKLIEPFTTKSGTSPEYLRSSGKLRDYFQIIRSPREDEVPRVEGTYGVLEIVCPEVKGINWNVDGPRFMATMPTYEHPHGRPYRIVGYLKDSSDENLLCKIHNAAAANAVLQTRAAFGHRRRDSSWLIVFARLDERLQY
jgi:hypothetical protein